MIYNGHFRCLFLREVENENYWWRLRQVCTYNSLKCAQLIEMKFTDRLFKSMNKTHNFLLSELNEWGHRPRILKQGKYIFISI